MQIQLIFATFNPHFLTRNPHFQTIISSLLKSKPGAMGAVAQEMIVEAGETVRLQGFYSPQPKAKGLVLLLHGWLGQANSSYNIAIGEALYRHGYAIFRLNMRDHGDTHRLNPAPFRGDLLDEVVAAAHWIAQLEPDQPFFVIGSSLGGNFALRLAWRQTQSPIPTLAHTLAINPALNPYHSSLALDRGLPLYLAYFKRKWRRAFQKKQLAFPNLYDFKQEINAATCMQMTELFVRHCSPYPDAQTYFASYTITPAMLAQLSTPVTMITASDDPIVPITDFAPFRNLSPYLKIHLQTYGGHVGFVDLFPLRRWIGQAACAILAQA